MPERHCELSHLPQSAAALRRQRLLSARTVEAMAGTFRVLGDPTRIRILDALAAGELCVCDIAALAGISESAVSHQLRLLRGMRLVRPRRAGRLVFYSLDDQHILELLRLAGTHVQESSSPSPAAADERRPAPGAVGQLAASGAGQPRWPGRPARDT